MTDSKTIWLAIVNLVLAGIAAFLPAAGAPEAGAALTDFMSRPEYIAGMASLATIFMRLGIKKAQKAAES